jgi:hypothetical protein
MTGRYEHEMTGTHSSIAPSARHSFIRAAAFAIGGAVAYAYLALVVLSQVNDAPWSWAAFCAVHVASLLGIAALGVRSGSVQRRVAWVVAALALWIYLFFFVWLNVWGA